MPKNKLREAEYQEPFIPLAVFENALRFWWVVALLMLAGGLAGFLAHLSNPPVYEATASFSIAIDYVGTGPMTQYAEDLAINTAGNIYLSSEVLERVVDQAGKEGLSIRMEDLATKISLERNFSIWLLRVRDMDPQAAQRLAAIWMEQGKEILVSSYEHSVSANRLDRYIQSQERCLEKQAAGEPAYSDCGTARFSDIQANLRDAGTEFYKEREASRGIFSGLTLGPFNPAEVSSAPVTSGRNQFIFLGSLLGLLVSLVILETGIMKHAKKRS